MLATKDFLELDAKANHQVDKVQSDLRHRFLVRQALLLPLLLFYFRLKLLVWESTTAKVFSMDDLFSNEDNAKQKKIERKSLTARLFIFVQIFNHFPIIQIELIEKIQRRTENSRTERFHWSNESANEIDFRTRVILKSRLTFLASSFEEQRQADVSLRFSLHFSLRSSKKCTK